MIARTLVLLAGLSMSALAFAQPSLNLSDYTLGYRFNLPGQIGMVGEASAITYNWDTGTLFVVGDEAEAIVEVTKTGEVVGHMTLNFGSNFDAESLTYIGNGQFALGEERTQSVYKIDYQAGTTLSLSSVTPAYSFGNYSNNEGLEGLSWDPRTNTLIAVKEKNPQAIYEAEVDFDARTGSQSILFNAALLGLQDLSDVQVLATVPSFLGTGLDDNLLIISQESRLLLEVTRTGEILGSIDLRRLSGTAEGVTIDELGNIYISDEQPRVFVFLRPTPAVPEPETYALLLAGLGLLGFAARRRAA
ncbi:SdiA-regulated domain-containing protein [Methylobacillus flagellatus]|uniref:SdiA-regulated domain-containing protein n=1 Tax=Methylobacillus flagellatus TaxID=405 RepID=UPI0028539D19|nr:SdiA-regulated domain-containing protein [Methylobacillus flagellatus]MDR5171801.1 SdiA-regulated domain-containing protein [Methylobacillus flagellatus]